GYVGVRLLFDFVLCLKNFARCPSRRIDRARQVNHWIMRSSDGGSSTLIEPFSQIHIFQLRLRYNFESTISGRLPGENFLDEGVAISEAGSQIGQRIGQCDLFDIIVNWLS